jgi:hypothetical protein
MVYPVAVEGLELLFKSCQCVVGRLVELYRHLERLKERNSDIPLESIPFGFNFSQNFLFSFKL